MYIYYALNLIKNTFHTFKSDLKTSTKSFRRTICLITVIAAGLLRKFQRRVFLIEGYSSSQKRIRLADINIDEEEANMIIGFHAFTGWPLNTKKHVYTLRFA